MKLDFWMDFMIDDEDKLWFIDGKNTGLFYVSKKHGNVKFVEKLPMCYEGDIRAYNGGVKYQNKLFFSPFHAKSVLIYKLDEQEWEEIYLDIKNAGEVQFANIIVVENYMIMVSTYKEHALVKFDLKNYNYKFFEFGNYLSDDSTLSRDMICIDNTVVFVAKEEGIILQFNIMDEKFAVSQKKSLGGFGTIAYDGTHLWLSGENGIYKLVDIDEQKCDILQFPADLGMYINNNNEKIYLEGFVKECSKWGQPFFRSFICKDNLVCVSGEMNKSLVVDLKTGSMKTFALNISEECKTLYANASSLNYMSAIQTKEGIFLYSVKEHVIYRVDINEKMNNVETLSLEMEYDDWKEFFKKEIKLLYDESTNLMVTDYLDVITDDGYNSNKI